MATDASARQIEEAPRLERVRFAVAPAETSGLPDASVDLVSVAQALHWFDLPAFFGEVRRVLAPRGVFAAWCYGLLTMAPGVDAVLNRFYREVVGEYWPAERAIVERGYACLAFPFSSAFDEITPPQFAMEKEWTLAELLGYVRTWSAVRRYAQARGEDPVAGLERDLTERWGPPGKARKAIWDLDLRMSRKR